MSPKTAPPPPPLPEAPPQPEGPPPLPPPYRHPQGWIVIGPQTRVQMAGQLERLMPVVWLALMETSGVREGAEMRLVIDGAHLEPATAPGVNGQPEATSTTSP